MPSPSITETGQLTRFHMIKKLDRRTCRECGEEKPLSEFPTVKGPSGKIFYRGVCKTCRREHVRDWRNTHQEHIRGYKRQYYLRNREMILAKVKARHLKYREKKLE